MLTSDTLLQDRYRILRKIGGGGMGEVYLAEDTRLPGRRCAIKEMSPAQLPAQDRNWAINAFRQEAQMLANISHSGLTPVTDFFPEKGNWYLVMDYVKGETLEKRLKRARKGRLPLDEALDITRQLCHVLEYLHKQNPPVVFRDLKPSNVMLTPDGEVKLIDFGIARFFKPGKAKDTVNLGTPGYAAPEQYGGQGQSDPRTDVYSLGVLLHQMVTGYDPSTASTPFPLPSAESLTRNLPPHVENAVSRAIDVHPDRRFQSVRDFQKALFPPTSVMPQRVQPSAQPHSPTQVQPAIDRASGGAGKKIWIGLGVAVALIGACAIALGGGLALLGFFDGSTPTVDRATTYATTVAPPTVTEPPIVQTTQAPPTTPPTVDSTVDTSLQWSKFGQSVQGRDLEVGLVGDPNGAAIVVVGSIQGDQSNTRDLIDNLAGDVNSARQRIPTNVAFHFIPTINPDGNASGTRRNANDVDLNRNWDTFDWTANPEQPGGAVTGAGGSRPHSEPETQNLADYLLARQRQDPNLRVVVWHASQRLGSGEGHVYPGYTSSDLDQDALDLAWRYAGVTGYTVKEDWEPYQTTGELITWCAEQTIPAIDVVIPRSVSGYDRSLRDTTMKALLEIVP
jgi:serine/threonine-protein kinase